VPIASRTGETAHVVDGELVSAIAFGPMVVFDDQAFRLVAEGALEFLLAGQFDDYRRRDAPAIVRLPNDSNSFV
jgi:hypothetical protein